MARRSAGTVPLARALSKLGLASRTEAAALVREGRVAVDGRRIDDPATPIVPERAQIAIDGRLRGRPARIAIALHKPRGVVTTRRDPEGRETVYDLVRDLGVHVATVGRLDWASTGLLLLTNDTRLADALTDPSRGVPRRYIVTVRGEVSDETADRAREGLVVDGEPLAASRVVVRKRSRRESHLVIELVEGRNREIRRLLGALGHEVTRLMRVSFGSVELGRLEPGQWRRLDDTEVTALERDAGVERLAGRTAGAAMTREGLARRRGVR